MCHVGLRTKHIVKINVHMRKLVGLIRLRRHCTSADKNTLRNPAPTTHKLYTTEMRMLSWARRKTKKDHIKNEIIWREANVEPITTFIRKRRLRWYGRKEGDDTT